MAKSAIRIQARELRSKGESIKTIARDLNVSSSTASLWCRDIILTPLQIAKLEKNFKDPLYGRRLSYSLKQQAARKVETEKIISEARANIGKLTDKELMIAGTALYWAEGFKKDKMVGFANTDPQMILFIIVWLQRSLQISKDLLRLRVGINESHKNRTKEIMEYWSKITNIPLEYFLNPYYQKVIWKKTYDHPEEYFGTLRIRVHKSTKLLKRIMGMIDGIHISVIGTV